MAYEASISFFNGWYDDYYYYKNIGHVLNRRKVYVGQLIELKALIIYFIQIRNRILLKENVIVQQD